MEKEAEMGNFLFSNVIEFYNYIKLDLQNTKCHKAKYVLQTHAFL